MAFTYLLINKNDDYKVCKIYKYIFDIIDQQIRWRADHICSEQQRKEVLLCNQRVLSKYYLIK